MEPKAPQFSAYDFLGYLLPGLVLIGLMDCSWVYHSKKSVITWDFVVERYSALTWQNTIPLALFGYFLGHLVSFVSSLVVEEHATLMHGRPESFIVRDNKPKYFNCGKWEKGHKLVTLTVFFMRAITMLIMLPMTWIELLFTRIVPLSRRYSFPITRLLKRCLIAAEDKLLEDMGVRTPSGKLPGRHKDEVHWGLGFERLALHYALETAPAHLFTLRNYVVLYGFLRAMTFILLVCSWMIAGHMLFKGMLWQGSLFLLLAGVVISPCYGAFLKFWTRYHKEALMAFLASMAKRTADSPHPPADDGEGGS